MKDINFLFPLRIIVAAIFIVSGSEKLLSPSENFLYVIQNYQVLPFPFLERLVVFIFPWAELILGIFLLLGLWLRLAVLGTAAMTGSFIVVVGQAVLRRLPIQSCGCFGDLVKVPLPVIIIMDSLILLSLAAMLHHFSRTKFLSLDRFFAQDCPPESNA